MAANRTYALAGVVARVFRDAPETGRTDGEVLTAFVESRDPCAFADLVKRHGPMVLGVCRRVLRHAQDAEDAFQATFMVLARKAAAVSPRNAVGNWLYGVAFQTGVRARAIIMKRKARESVGASIVESSKSERVWDDVAVVLDEELARLPEHYRAMIVLCDVEGRTRADAAAHLGCPEGSVSSRLSRARKMLARRLVKRGVTLSAGALAAMVGQYANAAALPVSLMRGAIEAAGLAAAGSTLANVVPPAVITLTDGVIKAMIVSNLKSIAVTVLAISLVGFGGFAGYRQATGQEPGQPKTAEKHAAKDKPNQGRLNEVNEKKNASNDVKRLQGDWVLLDLQQTNHEATKEEKEFLKKGGWKVTITGDNIIHSPDKSEITYRLDLTKTPKVLEWLEDGKVVAKAIYELNGDDLRFCQGRRAEAGEEPEPPADFDIKKAAPGTFPTLFVLKRDTAKPAEKANPTEKDETKLLIGRWVSKSVTTTKIPKERIMETPKYVWTFDAHGMKTQSSSTDFRYTLNQQGKPKELNIIGNKVLLLCIYELNGDALKVGFFLFGSSEVSRPKGFDPKDNPADADPLMVIEFVREAEEPKPLPKFDPKPMTGQRRTKDEPKMPGGKKPLEGGWMLVAKEDDGRTKTFPDGNGVTLSIDGDEFALMIEQEGLFGGQQKSGTHLTGKWKPVPRADKAAGIDLLYAEEKDKAWKQGIFKLEGDLLTICWGEKERPTDFTTKPGSGKTVNVFNRLVPKADDAAPRNNDLKTKVDGLPPQPER